MIAGGGNAERVLKTIEYSGIALKEILQALRQTRDDHYGIILPFVHLHKQFVERVNLIGVFVGQQFLHIVEKQDAALGLLDIIVPFVDKPLIVNGIDHGQFRLLYDLLLVEIVTKDLRKHGLSRSRLTNDNGVDGYPDFGYIFTRLKIGVGIDDGLQLPLHLVEADKSVKQVLTGKRLSTPLAELRYASVFLMTLLTNHYSTSFSNCFIISLGVLIWLESGLPTFSRTGLKTMKLSTNIKARTLHST